MTDMDSTALLVVLVATIYALCVVINLLIAKDDE
jgi:hypothetical protein